MFYYIIADFFRAAKFFEKELNFVLEISCQMYNLV